MGQKLFKRLFVIVVLMLVRDVDNRWLGLHFIDRPFQAMVIGRQLPPGAKKGAFARKPRIDQYRRFFRFEKETGMSQISQRRRHLKTFSNMGTRSLLPVTLKWSSSK